jgi:hypothetical protein
MAGNDRRIALRAPADVYKRAERIRDAMGRGNLGVRVATAEVLRMALMHGLKVLERRFNR